VGLAPADAQHDGLEILRAAAAGQLELLVLVGADPIADCPDADLARRALAGARRVISLDTFVSESTALADVVLAAAAYGEKAGTTTNLEGRVTAVAAKVTPTGTSRPDWMVAVELAFELGHDLGFATVDEITEAIAATVPAYRGVTPTALVHQRDGVLTSPPSSTLPDAVSHTRERNSYDYRLVVSRKLYDRAVTTAMSPSLARLAPGAAARVNPLDLDRVGVPPHTDVKIVSARGSVVLPLVGDSSVPRGTVWSPFNQPGSNIADVVDADSPVTDVRIERL
jgi:NADH-quinone oxidoreductase subunit G